jgi:hypothetical protein
MPIAYFPCLEDADTIQVTFEKPQGGQLSLRLLVDSGFTGLSSFTLFKERADLAIISAPPANRTGAISGIQARIIVYCRVPELSYQGVAAAILADLSTTSLPPGVDGLVGLQFLR